MKEEIFDNLKLSDYVYQVVNSTSFGVYKFDIRKLKIIDIDKKGRNIDIRLEHGVKFSTTSNKTHCNDLYTTYNEAKNVLFNQVNKKINDLKNGILKNQVELERYTKALEDIKKRII